MRAAPNRGRSRSRAATAVAVAAVGCGALLVWRIPMDPDSAWLLWLARRFLAGAVVYRDLWDTNPPLSHWLLLPPAAIIRATDWPASPTLGCYVLLWCGASLLFATRLWRRWSGAPLSTPVALAAGALMLFALPGPFFGEREHFMLAAALPWLVLSAVWASGEDVPWPYAAMAAAGAACAIALKPFYLGWWLLAPLLSPRAARRPAFWLVPALGLLYLFLVSRTPFLSYLRQWAPVYWRYGHRPWWFVTVGNPFALLPVGAALITAKSARATPLGAMLWAATLAAWLGAVGQGKAYPYHYFPAVGLSLLLLAYASRSSRRGVAVPVGLGWTLYLLYFIIVGAHGDRTAARELDRAVGPARVMVLSEAADHAWLLTSEYGRPWLSTHYNLWWLEISHGRDTVPGLPRWPEQNEILRHSLVTPRLPEVLLLGEEHGDVGRYLAASSEWRDSLAKYQRGASIAGYQVWRRRRGE